MKMANEKKSIIEEALLEAEQIDAAFKSNAKEILAQTMSSEIEEMVKESLTGSKRRLKEEEEETEETEEVTTEEAEDLDLDLDSEEETEEGEESEEDEEEDMDLDLNAEESEEMDLEFDSEENEDMDLDLGDESEEGEMDLDIDMGDTTPEMGGEEVIDLTKTKNFDDVISVFKKMGPEDEIEVVNDNGMVTLKDNKSGSEYRIEMNPRGGSASFEAGELGLEEGSEDSEEIIYEIVVDDEDEDEMSYMHDEDSMKMGDDMSYMDDGDSMKMGGDMSYASEDEDEDGMNHMDDKMSYMKNKGLHYTEKYNDNPRLKGRQKTALPDELQKSIAKNGEDEMSYMSRTSSTKGRYATGNRTNSNAVNRMGGDESYKSTYGMAESKTPQITKIIKENTDLNIKLTSLETENTELKETQEKMVDALKQFRKKLQEVAVFNSNLTYAVRLFTENSTTKEEKQEVLKRLDSAKDLKESQSIYKHLVKEFSTSKATIKESIDEKINKTASSGAQISEQSVFVHPEIQNMKKLWEYSYKK